MSTDNPTQDADTERRVQIVKDCLGCGDSLMWGPDTSISRLAAMIVNALDGRGLAEQIEGDDRG